MSDAFFKGWAKPGPVPSAAINIVDPEATSLDFLSGHYRLFQLKQGHRFSTDDVLIAWYGTSWAPCPRRVLDLGSGLGSVAMMAAWRLQGAQFVTVEAQEISVALARQSVRYNDLEGRFDIRHGDFRDEGVLASHETFDLILGSPPYFAMDAGVHGDHPQKVACRFEIRGTVADYCRTAAKHLAVGGFFSCVFPMDPKDQLEKVLTGARDAGLSIVRWRPVALREGNNPLLALFCMVKSEDLPEKWRQRSWQEPTLTVRGANGEVNPEYMAIKLSIGFPP